jgi:hypothetical protein
MRSDLRHDAPFEVSRGKRWLVLLALQSIASLAWSSTETVPAVTDIWLAGQPNGTSVTGEFGTDVAPANSPVLVNVTAGSVVSFAASGSTSVDGSCFAGPDGGCYSDESIFGAGPADGIGSYKGPATALIGVFLDANTPAGNGGPASLDYTKAANRALPQLEPELNQIFFIGDGRTGTGSGSVQKFVAPVGATRLYLSIADSLGSSTGNVGQLSVTVNELLGTLATKTKLSASPSSAPIGSSVSLTALVSPPAGSPAPTGTVDFKNGSAQIGTVTLNGTGQATLSTSGLGHGTHSITAAYSGNALDAPSTSNAVTVTVTAASATTTTLSAVPAATSFGTAVVFTATVKQASGPVPHGKVTFKNGTATLGTSLLDAAGKATLSIATLAPGTHKITAAYAGDVSDRGSTSAAISVVVSPVATTTVLKGPHASSFGTAVSFSATVKSDSGKTTPTGIVTFKSGAQTLGKAKLTAAGSASFVTSKLTVGSDLVTAAYDGDAAHRSSTSTTDVVIVTPVATKTTLVAAPTTAPAGTAILLTATVKPATGSAVPTGSVKFLIGTKSIGSAALGAAGTAKLSTSKLPVGTDSLTADYAGNSEEKSSTSAPITVSIN